MATGAVGAGHRDGAKRLLNDLCGYCGALPVSELKKGHVAAWVDGHPGWVSSAIRRSAIAIVTAAFNHARANHDAPNPVKGLKRPSVRPRRSKFRAVPRQNS